MDYKEKLRLAKEALDSCSYDKETIEYIFPELKKSEDERTRKELLDYLEERRVVETLTDTRVKEEWIAWLEKQSTPQVRTGIEWVNIIDDACEHRYAEEYAHGEYCHEQSFRWGFQEGVDWLEKQGEQKSNPYSGASFEYNGHTWGMRARDGGVEILIDSYQKAFVSLDKSVVYPLILNKTAPKYEWDAEKKKLRKIEQKSTWSE